MSVKKHAQLIKRAENLRLEKRSLREISLILHISKGTASLWLKHLPIELPKDNLIKAGIKIQENRKRYLQQVQANAQDYITDIFKFDGIHKLICACLFWAEGTKVTNGVHFTNSDPYMIKTFVTSLRKAYKLDESKLRVKMHLHEYHSEVALLDFWSKVTKIPPDQFTRSYLKPHSGKRKKDDYKGCIRVTYHDYRIALDLKETYNAIANAV